MAHLNGEPRDCPLQERHALENELINIGKKAKKETIDRSTEERPFVGGILPDGSAFCPYEYLYEIEMGQRFADNPYLQSERDLPWLDLDHQHPNPYYQKPSSDWLTNYQCWKRVTHCQSMEVFFHGENPDLPAPRLNDMLMRSEHDFYGGSVQDFCHNWVQWMPLIRNKEYLDRVYSSVHTGCDFLHFSHKVHKKNAKQFRKNCFVYSKAFLSLNYCLRYKGQRRDRKQKVDEFLKRGKKGKIRKSNHQVLTVDRRVPYTAGFFPVRRFPNKDGPTDRMVCPESKKSREYPTTIYKQLVKWLKAGVIEFLGSTRELGKAWIMTARLFLAIIVEPFKPRVCLDGSISKCITPKKAPPCRLDSISALLALVVPGCLMVVCDDKSGFSNMVIDPESRPFAAFRFGGFVGQCTCLFFGHRTAPAYYQEMNMFGKIILSHFGLHTCLYIDDRIGITLDPHKHYEPGRTSREAYMICLLTNSLGVFLSATKSHWIPSKRVTFLGFIVDSDDCTIEIMPEKYARVCDQIHEILNQSKTDGFWDMHLLEVIRGKLISWLIVITDMKIFIRELNVAIARAYDQNQFHLENSVLADLHIQNELEVWLQLKSSDLKRKWLQDSHVVAELKSFTISTDASGFAAGLAFGPQRALQYRTFTWNLSEYGYRIHYKELWAIEKGLYSLGEKLRNSRVKVLCDNIIVVAAFRNDGVKDHIFTRNLRRIYKYCRKMNIHLTVEWVSTHVQQADAPSRSTHLYDSCLRYHLRVAIKSSFKINVDLCASAENRVTRRFISQYEHPESEGIDCMGLFRRRIQLRPDSDFKVVKSLPVTEYVPYCFPPDVLSRPIIRDLVHHFDQFIYILNVYRGRDSTFAQAKRKFDYYLIIGDSQTPAIVTPTRRQRNVYPLAEPYSRLNREISTTYMFVKGFSMEQILDFKGHVSKKHFFQSASEKSIFCFLNLLNHSWWTNRNFLEIRSCRE